MTDPWAWHAHPDVWLVVGLLAGSYTIALTRNPGATSRRQMAAFFSGVVLLWVAADWPVHDIGENYLFSVHMVQHVIFSLVVPPLLLVGTPPWLMRRLLSAGPLRWAATRLCRPLLAALIYNAVVVLTHWPPVTNASLRSEPLHFSVHALIFTSALIMWFPVLNRLPEFPTMSPPVRMIYLFLQSIIPTVPASFITFADGVVYDYYATVARPWAITAVHDQQLAGAVMKIVGGLIIWGVIVVMFFRWYSETEGRPDTLTWEEVERELERTRPPA